MEKIVFYTMKLSYLLLSAVNSGKIIKNINIPVCRNCIYYKPDVYGDEFSSIYSRCEKFGEKNIITDEIKYDYVDDCRKNESKCGFEGKYFEEEKDIDFKRFNHYLRSKLPIIFPTIILFSIVILNLSKD
jgi:hypothetical protein